MRKGKDSNRRKSGKTDDESSDDEVDEEVLNACIASLQAKVAAQKNRKC